MIVYFYLFSEFFFFLQYFVFNIVVFAAEISIIAIGLSKKSQVGEQNKTGLEIYS
jgi:hypothetical protein